MSLSLWGLFLCKAKSCSCNQGSGSYIEGKPPTCYLISCEAKGVVTLHRGMTKIEGVRRLWKLVNYVDY